MGVKDSFVKGFECANRLWIAVVILWVLQAAVDMSNRIFTSAIAPGQSPSLSLLLPLIVRAVCFLSVYSTLWLIWYGGLMGTLSQMLRGVEESAQEFLTTGLRLFWPMVWLSSLEMGIMLGLFLLLMLAVAGLALLAKLGPAMVIVAVLLGIGIVLTIVLLSMGLAVVFLYAPMSLVELQQGVMAAMRDAFLFVRRRLGGTLGIVGLMFVLGAAAMIVCMILAAFSTGLHLGMKPETLQQNPMPLWLTLLANAVSSYGYVFFVAVLYAYYSGNRESGEPEGPTNGNTPL